MSLATLERRIVAELRVLLKHSKLGNKDLLEWSTSPIEPQEGDVIVRLEELGVNCAVPTDCDKRPKGED